MSYKCVIVESPAKCKKIESYLGAGYKCIASYGHLRQLKQLKDVGIDKNFVPTYTIIEEPIKLKQIERLKETILNATEVILATDDDREGEAIAWHLCILFDLPVHSTKRIVFHEITKDSLLNAILIPRVIDMDLVHAQQARQILDLLVGYTITPVLWECISKTHKDSLSAGRCQTPALRLIYDNYLENKHFVEKRVYKTIGYFTSKNIPFELSHMFETEESLTHFLENSVEFEHMYTVSKPKESKSAPPSPLTTSSLQQLASNELHMSPKETMKHAQELYEHGLITYMRTDSKTYCKEFIMNSKEYILRTYNDTKYINENIDLLSETSNKKDTDVIAQEAHEAIRPVDIRVKLENIADTLDSKSKRLYHLIWKITLQSCMSSSVSYYVNAEITAFQDYTFKTRADQLIFQGWKVVEKKQEQDKSYYDYLLNLKPNSILDYKKMVSTVHIKEGKSHYTEARLVQLLEEKGIGRPSTFSTLIDKIQERGYVSKESIKGITVPCAEYELDENVITEKTVIREFGSEKNKLVIQPLGILVIELLIEHFNSMFQYDYTKKMEDELDLVSQGKQEYSWLCEHVSKELNTLMEPISKKKCKIQIDNHHEFMIGKHGPVIKKTVNSNVQFIAVKKDIDIGKLKANEYELSDLIDNDKIKDSIGSYQGMDLFIKKGKYGIYAEWGKNKKSLTELGNKPIQNITYIEVLKLLEKDGVLDPLKPVGFVREISNNITIRTGKFGDYIFYKTSKMKKAQFFPIKEFKGDYKTCSLPVLKQWIQEKHSIS